MRKLYAGRQGAQMNTDKKSDFIRVHLWLKDLTVGELFDEQDVD